MSREKKKNKKHQSFHKAIKPFVKDNRILYSILGAFGAGVALAAVVGSEKGGDLINNISAAVKEFTQHKAVAEKKSKLPKPPKLDKIDKPDKPNKPKKLFSKEDF